MILRAELHKIVVTSVPFVDFLNILRDSKISYTISDWYEFENSNI